MMALRTTTTGAAYQWDIGVLDAISLAQDTPESALVVERILHHRFKSGREETYASTSVPLHLLPLYFFRNRDIDRSHDVITQQALLQLAGWLVSTDDQERRVTVNSDIWYEPKWYFEQVSPFQGKIRCHNKSLIFLALES